MAGQQYDIKIRVIGEDQASGPLSRVSGALNGIGQIAAGTMLAQGVMGAFHAASGVVSEALDSYAGLERMGMSYTALVANELAQGQLVTKTQQTRVTLTSKEREELENSRVTRDQLTLSIEKENAAYEKLVRTGKADPLATREHQVRLEGYNERLGDATQAISALEAQEGKYVTTTTKVREGGMSMADAMKAAAGRSQELMGWTRQLAIESPFDTESVATSLRLGMAYGFTSTEAQRLTGDLVDFSAATGQTGEVMTRMATSLGQVRANGKMNAQDMRELAMAGLPIRQILAEAFHVTTEEINRMSESGELAADKVLPAVEEAIEKAYKGAGKAQANTFSGLLSSLTDIKKLGLADFFESTFKAIQPYMVNLVGYLTSPEWKAALAGFGKSLGEGVARIIEDIKRLVNSPEAQRLMEFAKRVGESFDILTGTSGMGSDDPFVRLREALRNIVPTEWQPTVIGFVNGVETEFGKLKTWADENGPKILDAIKTGIQSVIEWGKSELPKVWSALTSGLGTTGELAGKFATFFGQVAADFQTLMGNTVREDWQERADPFATGADRNPFAKMMQSMFDGLSLSNIVKTALGVVNGALDIALITLKATWKTALDIMRGDWDALWKDIGNWGSGGAVYEGSRKIQDRMNDFLNQNRDLYNGNTNTPGGNLGGGGMNGVNGPSAFGPGLWMNPNPNFPSINGESGVQMNVKGIQITSQYASLSASALAYQNSSAVLGGEDTGRGGLASMQAAGMTGAGTGTGNDLLSSTQTFLGKLSPEALAGVLKAVDTLKKLTDSMQINFDLMATDAASILADLTSLGTDVGPQLMALARGPLEELKKQFAALRAQIQMTTDAARRLGEVLAGINAGIFQPGSPSPLEIAMHGINSETSDLTTLLTPLSAMFVEKQPGWLSWLSGLFFSRREAFSWGTRQDANGVTHNVYNFGDIRADNPEDFWKQMSYYITSATRFNTEGTSS